MNLTKLEKAVIIILVVGGILAAGIFFFILPAYEQIGKEQRNRDSLQQQRTELYAKLERENTIDGDIQTAQKDAEKYEVDFYPDLTTYEAVEIILAHLKECELDTNGIAVSPISATDLTLEHHSTADVVYDLKSFSETARGEDPDALAVGQFKDGGKVYEVAVASVGEAVITNTETGEEVPRSSYTETMKKAYKEAICKYVAESQIEENVGVTTLTFEVTGTYENYLKFLDYIYDLDRATYLEKVIIPATYSISEEKLAGSFDDNGNYVSQKELSTKEIILEEEPDTIIEESITLYFYSVEPMKKLSTIKAAGQDIVVDQR